MKMRYLAIIKMDKVPKNLLPLGPGTIGKMLSMKGWEVTHLEKRGYGHEGGYGHEVWVTLERNIEPPTPLLPCCEVHGDRSVTVALPQA